MPVLLRRIGASAVIVAAILMAGVNAEATSVKKMNVADLVALGDQIVIGRVTAMSDGFDASGLPYTDVTVAVSQKIKGNARGYYTFRQFGLMAPRDLGHGGVYLGVSPDGFPKFKIDEDVMLFLFKKTALGFQSSVGLFQGKFTITDDKVANAIDNLGLFDNINIDSAQLTQAEQKMLQTKSGAASSEHFVSFVTKAVNNGWFE